METAFVAGATGYTGRAVVEELRRRGIPTVAHVRPGSSSLAEAARPSFVTGPDRRESRPLERIAAAAGDALLSVAALLGARRLRDRYASLDATALARALATAALDTEFERAVLPADELRRLASSPGGIGSR